MNFKELIFALPFEFERSICHKFNKLLNRRPSSTPFLSGDTFKIFANFLIETENELQNFCQNIENINKSKKYKKNLIILVSSKLLVSFAACILPQIKVPFVLLSHQSDENITSENINASVYLKLAQNPHLIFWFAQNCTLQHPKIEPLPIGLENQHFHNAGNVKSFKKLQKKLKAKKVKKQPKVLVALNFSTNPQKRFNCYISFWKKPITKELTSFVSSKNYRKILANCMFVASPSGNGLDCHRTWEAMYLNCIPLVEKNEMTEYFKNLGLPMLCIENWENFANKSEGELVEIYNETMKNCNKSPLYIDFWKDRILKSLSGLPR